MKKLYLLVSIFLISALSSAQNPVPNHGFETWSGSPLNADGWYSNGNANNVLVTRVAGHTGNYSAKGSVIHFNGAQLTAPYLGCNFPVDERYIYMQFYYKASLDSDDVFQVSAAIYDTSNNILVANYFNIVFSSSNFASFVLNLDSVAAGVPDHALITFTIIPISPNPNPHINSTFVVDDVVLISTATGISENIERSDFLVYPNPSNKRIYIEGNLSEFKPSQIMLYDMECRIVFYKETLNSFNGKYSDDLNIEAIAPGIYLLRIAGENENILRKVIVE